MTSPQDLSITGRAIPAPFAVRSMRSSMVTIFRQWFCELAEKRERRAPRLLIASRGRESVSALSAIVTMTAAYRPASCRCEAFRWGIRRDDEDDWMLLLLLSHHADRRTATSHISWYWFLMRIGAVHHHENSSEDGLRYPQNVECSVISLC